MYPFGPGFIPPDYAQKIRLQAPKPAPPSSTTQEPANIAPPTTSESILYSGGELISYIFPDFNAVKYFQKDFLNMNEFHLAEETVCSGFEIYLVDQWIRSRKIGTVVSAFHGNYESKVKVMKFTVIKKPSKQYPARFQEYLNEVMLNHATFKKRDVASEMGRDPDDFSGDATPEFLLVTNISRLSSNLNLIPIPGGDTRKVESTFLINSNLRRLNCGGRSVSLVADKVSDASEDKFRQMYSVYNASVPIKFAIKELVNLIQTCLFYFDLLDVRYCDGLLCQKTEDAINNWWNLIGLPHFNTKPNPKAGILPSKSVAAIISLTISVKMRLQMFGGCDVPKDPFDFENFMISIGQFQKQIKIEKKRKLDLITLLQLFYFTNQKFNSDSTKQNFSTFGNEASLEDAELNPLYDTSANLSYAFGRKSTLYPTSTFANLTASVYRRNKLYYSKELKKLTNVVKNTVQDHIIVRGDDDDFYADASKAKSNKLRSKIALKLSDTVTPAEVETIDLDILVRKYLVGATLSRLWQGLSSDFGHGSSSVKEDGKNVVSSTSRHMQHRHHHHHHHSHGQSHSQGDPEPDAVSQNKYEDSKYHFVSLRDKIAMTQEYSNTQPSDKAGRLGRMRIALQGKKPNPIQKLDILSDISSEQKDKTLSDLGSPLLDAELQRISNGSSKSLDDAADENQINENTRQPEHLLNRRSSYPFLYSGAEASLSTMEYLKNETCEENKTSSLIQVKKSASFSNLEDYYRGPSELYSLERARVEYTDVVSKLLFLEYLKKSVTNYECKNIVKNYKHINVELVKLQNLKNHMDSRKSVIDKDYSALLTGRMRDLTDNIDRMAFRSRDLLKKINELESNTQNFDFKLNQECNLKLDDIVDGLIHSSKFRKVFKDEDERQKLIYQLNGHDYRAENYVDSDNSLWGLRAVAVFLYEMLTFLLQVFNFDRSNMNLDRIRHQYGKLDPNRRYINKAYNFIGRDLVSMLRSSTSDTSSCDSARVRI